MMGGYFGGCCGFGSLGTWGGILNLIITVGILIAFLLLVIWLVRRLTAGERTIPGDGQGDAAREILRLRYARGELTRDQYQEMLADMR